MFPSNDYELLDFGEGRRLERFGPWTLDRPSPAVEREPKADPARWSRADARYERGEGNAGRWLAAETVPRRWTVGSPPLALELKRTEFGHLGLFPEQAVNWRWLAEAARGGLRTLNLFAYTGASTLAAASAGAEVTHVDAARNVVAWARRNAGLSRLAEAPIRWIVDDATKFAKRELKRGAAYDGVILDPPSYGHGPHGEVWRLSKGLPRLLELCAALTAGSRRFFLLTCHTPDFDASRLGRMLAAALGVAPKTVEAFPLALCTAAGRELPCGHAARWSREIA